MQRRFSEEFKRVAVTRVQSGESQLSVARHLGINSKTLNRVRYSTQSNARRRIICDG